MASPSLAILDVGHGSCAVVLDGGSGVVIDAGAGGTLLDYLSSRGVCEVTALLISHADADHLGGAISVLAAEEIRVKAVFMNPDAGKGSRAFAGFRYALHDARRRGGTKVHTQLTTTNEAIGVGPASVEVVAPLPELATSGAGGRGLDGKKLTSNSLSAVVRVSVEGAGVALLTGDIDDVGLESVLGGAVPLNARVLVFPHHGGRGATRDVSEFAERLCAAVRPEVVVFSVGRGRFNNPSPETVAAVTRCAHGVHVACTQLAKACSAEVPGEAPVHLTELPAAGRARGSCCIGSIEIELVPQGRIRPDRGDHQRFVGLAARTALCRRETVATSDPG